MEKKGRGVIHGLAPFLTSHGVREPSSSLSSQQATLALPLIFVGTMGTAVVPGRYLSPVPGPRVSDCRRVVDSFQSHEFDRRTDLCHAVGLAIASSPLFGNRVPAMGRTMGKQNGESSLGDLSAR